MENHHTPPRTFAHYELLDQIGRGGMGVVYRAQDTRLGRPVAIKVLPAHFAADPDRRARFLREARAAARLNHPAIATVYEVGETRVEDSSIFGGEQGESGPRDVVYLAMEHVEGEDLDACLERELTLKETLDFGIQIAEGLAAAHANGVIHRDLKPQNVRITPQGRVKILDFGLAKVLRGDGLGSEVGHDPTLTTAGGIVGTVPYMAPEQLQGPSVDARSDLFSFGVLLYRMLTGRLPFAGGRLIDYVKALSSSRPDPPSKSNPAVSPELERVVDRLLQKEPAERYPSAAAVGEDLKFIARGRREALPTPPPRDSVFSEVRGPLAGPRLVWAALVLVALLAVAGGTALWRSRGAAGLPVESLAVLPFENRTDDPSLDAYYEGVGAALARKLSRVRGLSVESELQVRRFRGSVGSIGEIARELGVGTLIQGYVQGNAERIRIVVQVLDAAGVVVWDGEVEGAPGDLLDLQGRLVEEVLRRLPVSLSPRERQKLRENPTTSGDALDAYFSGMQELERVDEPAAAQRAVERFSEAVEIDPEFAWAYGALSEALLLRYEQDRDAELLERAVAAADRAVEIDPEAPELRIDRARVSRRLSRHEEAVADLEGALAVNPDLDLAHRELALTRWEQGKLEEAEASYRAAAALRPISWRHWNDLGMFFLRTARYEEARQLFERAAELAPDDVVRPLENLGTAYLAEMDLAAALAAYERIPRIRRPVSLMVNMGSLYFMQGEFSRAEQCFRTTVERQPAEPQHWLNLGDAQSRLGTQEAIESYGRALRLVSEQLEVAPGDERLLALLPLALAKEGSCERAVSEARALEPRYAAVAEAYLFLAKALAVCREREGSLAAVRVLVEGGMPPQRIRSEFEFDWLGGDPEFEALLAAAVPPP